MGFSLLNFNSSYTTFFWNKHSISLFKPISKREYITIIMEFWILMCYHYGTMIWEEVYEKKKTNNNKDM